VSQEQYGRGVWMGNGDEEIELNFCIGCYEEPEAIRMMKEHERRFRKLAAIE